MKKTISIILICFISLLFIACNGASTDSFTIDNDLCYQSKTDGVLYCDKVATSYFDTTVSLRLYYQSTDTYDIDTVFNEFIDILETYHQLFDKYNEYEAVNNIYTINHSVTETIVDPRLFEAIDYAIDHSNLVVLDETELFNIAIGPVAEVWHNARENVNCNDTTEIGILYCPVPYTEIDEVTFNTNISDILLNEETSSISFLKENMSLDLGGFAKGYIANIITEYLNQFDVTYILNLGNSNVIAHGVNPTNDHGDFVIALTEPSLEFNLISSYYLYLKIPADMGCVTSGNYQRFFKEIGTEDIYHHIIDPRTNYPGGDVMSVSILYNDSAIADILSTSIYLMDLDSAVQFVNDTEGLEAVWYGFDGDITYSNNFEDYVYDIN